MAASLTNPPAPEPVRLSAWKAASVSADGRSATILSICPECGAMNAEEFAACLVCRTLLEPWLVRGAKGRKRRNARL